MSTSLDPRIIELVLSTITAQEKAAEAKFREACRATRARGLLGDASARDSRLLHLSWESYWARQWDIWSTSKSH